VNRLLISCNTNLLNRIKRIGQISANLKAYLVVLIMSLPVVSQAANVLSTPLCKAYKAVFDNDLFAVLGFFAMVCCLIMWMLDDGNSKTKTTALRIACVLLILLNIEQIFTLVFSRGLVC
jgi:hypothetical protein